MVNTIQPREYFPITRLLIDPLDAATYYLRAVIKNAKTGATIDTVSLAQISGRYYGVTWQVPADSSGRGIFILVTVEVYTDAGFTTRAEGYYDEAEMYFIYDRFNFVQGLATQISALAGDGIDIDYKKIDTILRKALKDGVKFPDFPTPEKTDLNPVLKLLEKVEAAVAKIPTNHPDKEEINLTPILDSLERVHNELSGKIGQIPTEHPSVDHTPVLQAVDGIKEVLSANGSLDQLLKLPEIIGQLADKVQEAMPGVSTQLEDIGGKLKDFLYAVSVRDGSAEKKPIAPKAIMTRGGNIRKS
jgi:hypothetical protein